MKVYERLKKYIDDNGIKQNHVASKAGIDFRTFNNKLHGRGRFNVEDFKRVCLLGLGVNPAIFFEDDVLETKTEDSTPAA